MGQAELRAPDGLQAITLCCRECDRSTTRPAPFYADRARVLRQARLEGWIFAGPEGPDRLCPVHGAIATSFGLRGSLAHELLPGFAQRSGEEISFAEVGERSAVTGLGCQPSTQTGKKPWGQDDRPRDNRPLTSPGGTATRQPLQLEQLDLFGGRA